MGGQGRVFRRGAAAPPRRAELFDAALRALPPGPVALPALRTAWLAQAPRRAETEALLARWLDEAHADEDVGPIRPEVLLEYLVSDGAVDGTVRTLMDELGKRPDLIGKGLGGALGDGLTPGLALDLLDQLTGPKDPTLQKWLDAAKGVLGQNREAELRRRWSTRSAASSASLRGRARAPPPDGRAGHEGAGRGRPGAAARPGRRAAQRPRRGAVTAAARGPGQRRGPSWGMMRPGDRSLGAQCRPVAEEVSWARW
ncbi:MAG: hypothetical protein U1F43_34425 [Myxococcota bacterium]